MLSVNAKINRALELLKQINDEYSAWKTSNSLQTTTECNVERTQFVLGVRFASEPQGLRWSLLAGELLFDLRCALDHLVYFLATKDSGRDPPADAEKLMFPIATSEQRFKSAVGRGQLNGLSDVHRDFIKSQQPYVKTSPPEDSALFALHYLNNVDKHRHLHISVFSVVKAEADLKGLPPGVTKVLINEEPLQKTDWVISFETSEPCRGPEGELKFSLRLGVFEERYRKHQLLEVLRNCIDAVIDVARLLLSKPGIRSLVINFCGAFARTDVMSQGVIEAIEALKPALPIFFSVHGTGDEEAIRLLKARLGVTPLATMDDACEAAVKAAAK